MSMSVEIRQGADGDGAVCPAPVGVSPDATRRRFFSNANRKTSRDRAAGRVKMTSVPAVGKSVALLHVLAALLWLPQAGLLAFSVGRIADGAPMMAIVPAAAAVLILGLIKAWLEKIAARLSFRAARAALSQRRLEAQLLDDVERREVVGAVKAVAHRQKARSHSLAENGFRVKALKLKAKLLLPGRG